MKLEDCERGESTGDVTKGRETMLEVEKAGVVVLVDLVAVIQELLEGNGLERHRFEEVELGTGGGDAAVEGLNEGGRRRSERDGAAVHGGLEGIAAALEVVAERCHGIAHTPYRLLHFTLAHSEV